MVWGSQKVPKASAFSRGVISLTEVHVGHRLSVKAYEQAMSVFKDHEGCADSLIDKIADLFAHEMASD